jgi:hypothetical protein
MASSCRRGRDNELRIIGGGDDAEHNRTAGQPLEKRTSSASLCDCIRSGERRFNPRLLGLPPLDLKFGVVVVADHGATLFTVGAAKL